MSDFKYLAQNGNAIKSKWRFIFLEIAHQLKRIADTLVEGKCLQGVTR